MFCRNVPVRRKKNSGTVPVYLNVYDLTPMNVYGYWLGIGIYHSGLEGKSFFFLLDSGFDCCSKIAEKDETIVGQFCWIVILIVEKIHCLYCCLALFDSKVCFDR